MNSLTQRIHDLGIVPVVVLQNESDAIPLAQSLIKGGLPIAEVTFRTSAAKESIRLMTTAFPDMIVGAGTVLTTNQVDEAVEAGAKFIVSPGFNPTVVEYCLSKGVLIIPGVSSASQIEQALSYNLTTLKFFPAEAIGGLPLIKALSAPYPMVKFMPTGGLSLDNYLSYLSEPSVLAIGGSWMVNPSLIKEGQFYTIASLTKTAVDTMHGFTIAHVGINQESSSQSQLLSQSLASMFGLKTETLTTSTFLSSQQGRIIELMHSPYYGEKGHIAISTHNVDRAYAYFKALGFAFRDDTLRYDGKKLKSVYFEQELGGFAFHLVQK
jgi:2-dehydro-3-deoxyphosphogluconate aldolase/(4S)-4-hydroxy-2-oxoglutarate aldolase